MKKKIIRLTETQLHKIVKRVLSEAYEGGLIQQDDAPCEIWCKVKLAKTGSNGDVVKMIQHLLAANGFNEKYVGGGMNSGCDGKWQHCDGKYRKHTKDAVLEFQRKYSGLKDDGIVGFDTLTVMCKNLKPSNDNTGNFGLCKQQCKCDDIEQIPPRLDNEDPIVPPGVGEYVPTGKDCATIVACIRQMGSSEGHGDKWYKFIKCLGKFKDKIFPPKQKDWPGIGICGDCPKWVNDAPRIVNPGEKIDRNYVIGYPDHNKYSRAFIEKCIKRGCTTRAV